MEVLEEQLQADPQQILALEEAFAHFSRQTAQLKEAYLKLLEGLT